MHGRLIKVHITATYIHNHARNSVTFNICESTVYYNANKRKRHRGGRQRGDRESRERGERDRDREETEKVEREGGERDREETEKVEREGRETETERRQRK